MDQDQLGDALLAAHHRQDHAALIQLYTLAADAREAEQDIAATCFFLTHAYVFALEVGAPERDRLNERLYAYGREERVTFQTKSRPTP